MAFRQTRTTYCSTCLDAHDDQIHAATISVHTWWRESLFKRLRGPDESDNPAPEITES